MDLKIRWSRDGQQAQVEHAHGHNELYQLAHQDASILTISTYIPANTTHGPSSCNYIYSTREKTKASKIDPSIFFQRREMDNWFNFCFIKIKKILKGEELTMEKPKPCLYIPSSAPVYTYIHLKPRLEPHLYFHQSF